MSPATSVTPDDLVVAVRTGLAALADPAKAGPMQAYMRSAMPYRGVTAQPLARFCKELFDRKRLDDGGRLARGGAGAVGRGKVPRGAVRRDHPGPAPATTGSTSSRTRSSLYRHLVVTGAWWDHVDEVATHLVRGLLERHPDAITPQLHDWARDRRPLGTTERDRVPGGAT